MIKQCAGSEKDNTVGDWYRDTADGACWHVPIISSLGRQRQGDWEFKTILVYIENLGTA